MGVRGTATGSSPPGCSSAPRQAVWDVLADVEGWPGMVAGVVAAAKELDPGDEDRVGSRYRVRWRAPVGYSVEFDFTVE